MTGATPQPPTGTEARVCADIARRQQLGIAKYGQTVADNPLSLIQWLQHAYEECLDQAVYLKRAIEEQQAAQERALRAGQALVQALQPDGQEPTHG